MLPTIIHAYGQRYRRVVAIKPCCDCLDGGEGEYSKPEDFDPHELAMGIHVELEHTNSQEVAQQIALDHLTEDPHYYTKLRTIHQD